MIIYRTGAPAEAGEGRFLGGADDSIVLQGQVGDVELINEGGELVRAVIDGLGINPSGPVFEPGGAPDVNGLSGFATARLLGLWASIAVYARKNGAVVASEPYEFPALSRQLAQMLSQSILVTWTQDTAGGAGFGIPLESMMGGEVRLPNPVDFSAANAAEVGATFDLGHGTVNLTPPVDLTCQVRIYGRFAEVT